MKDMNVKNHNQTTEKEEQALHLMRFFAQIAEKAGYTIAGVAAAYEISDAPGIISFGICMLIFAYFQSQLIHVWGVSLSPRTLRIGLLFRAFSFTALAYGAVNHSIEFMLLGASLSGLFVGLFWPTFYTMKKASIEGWFAVEKTSGVLLTISTGFLLLYTQLLWVLLFSIAATLVSLILTFRLQVEPFEQCGGGSAATPQAYSARRLALLEGAIGESLRMIRRLALLSGTVTLLNLDGLFSFALILGISEALGAIMYKLEWFSGKHFVLVAIFGSFLCIMGNGYWLFGLILLGMNLSALFPLLHSEMKDRLIHFHIIDLNFRERYRIEGRVAGAVFASGVYLFGMPMELVFVFIIVSLVVLANTSNRISPLIHLPLILSERSVKTIQ